MNDVSLIHINSKIHLFGRVGLFLVIYLIPDRGFLPEELIGLVRLLSPLSIFYLVAFIMLMIRYPYPVEGSKKGEILDTGIIWVISIGYVVYFALVAICGYYRDMVSFEMLINSVWVGEMVFGISAAISLPRIFHRFPLMS